MTTSVHNWWSRSHPMLSLTVWGGDHYDHLYRKSLYGYSVPRRTLLLGGGQPGHPGRLAPKTLMVAQKRVFPGVGGDHVWWSGGGQVDAGQKFPERWGLCKLTARSVWGPAAVGVRVRQTGRRCPSAIEACGQHTAGG